MTSSDSHSLVYVRSSVISSYNADLKVTCFLVRLISSWWFRIIFADRMTSSNLSKLSGTLTANLIKLSHQLLFPNMIFWKVGEISRYRGISGTDTNILHYITEPAGNDIVVLNRFPHHWPLVRGIHMSAVDSPRKRHSGGVLMLLGCQCDLDVEQTDALLVIWVVMMLQHD